MDSNEDLWLVIPTSTRFQYLEEIFANSRIPAQRRILIRTSPGTDISDCINIYELDIFNIHRWWNLGIDYAKSHGARYVAVLNDDVQLGPGVLQELLSVMKSERTALALPVNEGDTAWGHCWILDLTSGVRPDERFVWWCGDRDLEIQAQRSLGVSHKALPTLNIHANEITASNLKLEEITRVDIRSFYRKYPIQSTVAYPQRLWIRINRRLNRK
jgi:hypothetical protein